MAASREAGLMRWLAFVLAMLPALAIGGDLELLVFTRPGCAPCDAAKRAIAEDPTLTAGYAVRIVDTKAEPQLAREYRISSVPVFVLLRDGREIRRTVGFRGPERLREWLTGKANRRRWRP